MTDGLIQLDPVSSQVIENIMQKHKFDEFDKKVFRKIINNVLNENLVTHDITDFIENYFEEINE